MTPALKRGHSEPAPARGCGNGRGVAKNAKGSDELTLAARPLRMFDVPIILLFASRTDARPPWILAALDEHSAAALGGLTEAPEMFPGTFGGLLNFFGVPKLYVDSAACR